MIDNSFKKILFLAVASLPLACSNKQQVEKVYMFSPGKEECNGGGITLEKLYIDCDTIDGYCRPGGTGFVSGQIMADYALEEMHRMEIKFCMAWGLICTMDYFDEEISFCDDLMFQNENGYCPSSTGDVYQFSRNFTYPEVTFNLPNYLGFNAYAKIDDGTTICHAEFKKSSFKTSGSVSYTMSAIFLIGALGLGIFGNRRRCACIDLAIEEERAMAEAGDSDDIVATTKFERMSDIGGCSARV